MTAAASGQRIDTALVLGGGGPVGIAWLAGLVVGLRSAGIDPARADRIIGTSAGAVIGTLLASGSDFTQVGPAMAVGDPIEVDQLRLGQVFATLAEKGDELDKRRRVGQLALAADAGEPDAHIHRIAALAGVAEWPDADLQITSVDTDSGALQVWTRHTAATLAQALASSTSVPGVFPPIPIGQSRYMDGGMRSAINADLAAGADTVIIMEPLAHLFPRQRSDREHGAATEISIVPDAETIAVFGADMFSPTVLPAAYQAGIRQAGDAAPGLTGHGLDS